MLTTKPTNRKTQLWSYEGKFTSYALEVPPFTGWWLNQLSCKHMLVKLDHFPGNGEKKQYLKFQHLVYFWNVSLPSGVQI